MEQAFNFKTVSARRLPDPNFLKQHGIEKHIFLVRAKDMPDGISNDPNARTPNIKRSIYRDVANSLLGEEGEPGTFHLKNKGITILAESVKDRGQGVYDVQIKSGRDGILDGGHTYELIKENKQDIPDDQFVQVEIRVGIPTSWIPDIAGGLNTAMQVQDMSLDDLAGSFDWIKEAIGSFKQHIGWRENEDGEIDARDMICLLTLFNVKAYPNSKTQHPSIAYYSKKEPLNKFNENKPSYEGMKPIVSDILRLYDTIRHEARDVWNKRSPQRSRGGALSFIENRQRGEFDFPFIGETASYRLSKPALYPILGGFRNFVEQDSNSLTVHWKYDFSEILVFWRKYGGELLEGTYETSQEVKNLNALGKNSGYWRTAHAIIGRRMLEYFSYQRN